MKIYTADNPPKRKCKTCGRFSKKRPMIKFRCQHGCRDVTPAVSPNHLDDSPMNTTNPNKVT